MSTIHNDSVTPPSPTSPSHLSYSIYQSAYSSDDPTDVPLMSNIQASLYQSAIDSSFLEEREMTPDVSFSGEADSKKGTEGVWLKRENKGKV